MPGTAAYPVRVEARLDPGLSRWLWLVKWLLALPHYFVLVFLWIAFFFVSIAAFFAILFTGRYPRSLFEFNVGVLRWSWRVTYYAYGALGTDRYPPFTLAEVPDYPATLEIEYPERLSRGLVLVKWWLLAIPHYIIVGLFFGGGAWLAWRFEDWEFVGGVGLIGILVFIAGIVLAVTGRYPTSLFDLIVGLNRWGLRVAGYAGLMTDAYPPFRLDLGGGEPGVTPALPPPPPGQPAVAPGAATGGRWTALRVTAVVAGVILALVGAGAFAGGAVAVWADQTQRDAAGFVSTETRAISTGSYALTSNVDMHVHGPDWMYPPKVLDRIRIRITPVDPTDHVFVGIARSARVEGYLAGVRQAEVELMDPSHQVSSGATAPSAPPTEEEFWAEASTGSGVQAIDWDVRAGSWTIAVMNEDGSAGIDVRGDVGARVPALGAIGAGVMVFGGLVLAGAIALLVGAVSRATRRDI